MTATHSRIAEIRVRYFDRIAGKRGSEIVRRMKPTAPDIRQPDAQ